ncbi:MAG TPA: UvrB/UvrC motif-containing protein [Candidatus Udaeobacter sp.]|jgi:protein arginine kinase activator|nr:UvrB/UvrC motif-containing protein [Candidatus Udaeobacter sp.]
MLCQICGKTAASVHFTEIHDNKMSEIHVCERCAEDKGLHTPARKHKFDIADLLAGMVDSMTSTEEERVGSVQCPSCGLLYSQFRETGRVGCAECYNAFKFQLRPLLRRIHGGLECKAKQPPRQGGDVSRARQIQRLHDELQRLVEHEEFERAAAVRDEIRRLQAEPPATAETT